MRVRNRCGACSFLSGKPRLCPPLSENNTIQQENIAFFRIFSHRGADKAKNENAHGFSSSAVVGRVVPQLVRGTVLNPGFWCIFRVEAALEAVQSRSLLCTPSTSCSAIARLLLA